jgi:hypothetical protein
VGNKVDDPIGKDEGTILDIGLVGGCVGIIVKMLSVGNEVSKVKRVLCICDVGGKRVDGIVTIRNVGWIVGITLGVGAVRMGTFVRGDDDGTFVGRYVGGIEEIVGYCVG